MVEGVPVFWPLMRHGAGAGYSCLYSSFSPASGGRSHHSDPFGKAAMLKTWYGQPGPLYSQGFRSSPIPWSR